MNLVVCLCPREHRFALLQANICMLVQLHCCIFWNPGVLDSPALFLVFARSAKKQKLSGRLYCTQADCSQ